MLSHLLLCHWGPSTYFLMQILLGLVGPNLFGGGPAYNILRGALSAAADPTYSIHYCTPVYRPARTLQYFIINF